MIALPALLAAALAPQVGCLDDALEDNDTIQTAVALPAGSWTDLVVLGGGGGCPDDDDFYRLTVPDGQVLRVEIAFSNALGNLNLFAYDDVGSWPNAWLARSSSSTGDLEVVSIPNHGGAPLDVWLWVQGLNAFPRNVYTMTATLGPDACFGLAPDAFEPNDSCASAVPILPGSRSGLSLSASDPADWFLVDLGVSEAIDVTLDFVHDPAADLNLYLYDVTGGCPGSLAVSSITSTDDEHLVWTNPEATPRLLALRAALSSTSPGTCNDYSLDVLTFPDPCLARAPDPYEENDSCFDTVALVPGTYSGLTVFVDDEDDYRVAVPPGETLAVRIEFVHALGNVDARLFEEGLACTHVPTDVSRTENDVELLSATNNLATTQSYLIEVTIGAFVVGGTFDCNEYRMIVEVGGPTVGQPYCFGTDAACPCTNGGTPDTGCENSFGTGGARLEAGGNASVSADTLALHASGLPPTTSGLFFQGLQAAGGGAGVPFGDGLLCAEGSIVRLGAAFARAGAIDFGFGFTGGNPLSVRGAIPPAGGLRRYQLWYRNSASFCTPAAFNLSNGWEVLWAP